MPSCSAFARLDPARSPAMTRSVFLLTLDVGVPPRGADEVLDLLAAPARKRARDDDCLAVERFGRVLCRGFGFEGDACFPKFFNDGPIAFIREVRVDALRDGRADFVNRFDFFGRRFAQAVDAVKMIRERACNRGADVPNAQREEHAVERLSFALFERVEHVLGRLFGHAVEAGELLQCQVIEIAHIADEIAIHELFDEGLPQPLDIQRGARGKVSDIALESARRIGD